MSSRSRKTLLVVMSFALLGTGCGALLLVGGAGTSAIAYATGELRSTEDVPLAELDSACRTAIETLGFEEIETTRDPDRVRWEARTAGGEPVDIHLAAKGPERTELRIRIGVFAIREKHRAHIHAFLQQQVDATERGFDTRIITIVHDGEIVGEALDEPYLLHRKAGS